MVMVAMRRISLERRIGDKEKTEMLFQEYIDKAGMKNVRAFYAIKYARYLFKVIKYARYLFKVIKYARYLFKVWYAQVCLATLH